MRAGWIFGGAGATGLEPATSGVTGRRSNQLSYAPKSDGKYGNTCAVQRLRRTLQPVSGRPSVDVVLPFRGSQEQLERVAMRLRGLVLQPGDTVTIADNRPGARDAAHDHVRIIGAGELQTSYHARNRAVAQGTAPWVVFLDADVLPPPDLLERYFARVPGERVGVLAGTVVDEEASATAAARYAWLKSSMSQEITLAHDGWAFAQTANAAVRRCRVRLGRRVRGALAIGRRRRPLLPRSRSRLGARAPCRRRGRAPQSPDRAAHARPARAPRRRRGLAGAALARRAAAPALGRPGLVERPPRCARRIRRRARRPGRRAARVARRSRGVGVRARAADPQPPTATAAVAAALGLPGPQIAQGSLTRRIDEAPGKRAAQVGP